MKPHWTAWASLFLLAATLAASGLVVKEVEIMAHRKVIQSITSTDRSGHEIVTHRYEGESVEEWLAEHERALLRAEAR